MRKIIEMKWKDLPQIWHELFDKNPNALPFQSYDFLTFTGRGKPQRKDLFRLLGLKELNLVLYEDNEAIAIAPLQIKKIKEKYTVYFRGHFTTANELDFIYKIEWSYEDFKFLMDGIKGLLGDVSFFLDRVSDSSVTSEYLRKYLSSAQIETHDCYSVPVPQNYEDWLNNLHKHLRKNLIRRDNLLTTEHTNVQKKFVCGNLIDRKTSKEMMDIYAQRFLEKNNFKFGPLSSLARHILIIILSGDKLTQWLNKAKNNFHVILYVDNEIAAFHSGLICQNKRIVFSRLAINSKYAKYGPGGLLMSYLVQYVIEQNKNGNMDIEQLDLGQGGDNGMEYKKTHGGLVYYRYTFID